MLSFKVPDRCLLAQASLYVESGTIPIPDDVYNAAPEHTKGSKQLVRALRSGLISAQGELYEAFREGFALGREDWTVYFDFSPDEIKIAARLWDFANVLFEPSKLICSDAAIYVLYKIENTLDAETLVKRSVESINPSHSVDIGFMFTRITLPTVELFEHFPSAPLKQGVSAKALVGRPPKYDWDGFFAEIIVRADLDELPATQAELISEMAEWCLANWGEEPAASLLKSKTAAIFRHPRKSKGTSGEA